VNPDFNTIMVPTSRSRTLSRILYVIVPVVAFVVVSLFVANQTNQLPRTMAKSKEFLVNKAGERARESQICQDIPLLVDALKSNPQQNGLRPFSSNKTHFRGLDHAQINQAFVGRRIAFVGDSTLRYFTRWLTATIMMYDTSNNTTDYPDLTTRDLSNATTLLAQHSKADLNSSERPEPFIRQDGTHIAWFGRDGTDKKRSHSFNEIWPLVYGMNPEIIVANMGMHWLRRSSMVGPTVARWIRYESWLDEIVHAAKHTGAKVLLFKTTNFICNGKLKKDQQRYNKLYHAKSSKVTTNCKTQGITKAAQFNFTKEEAARYCEFGTFDEAGSDYLNERLRTYVKGLEKQKPSFYVGIFNDHDVESCDYTSEGRHYKSLNLLRIRLLANLLECALNLN
jgi:hypothetical protein